MPRHTYDQDHRKPPGPRLQRVVTFEEEQRKSPTLPDSLASREVVERMRGEPADLPRFVTQRRRPYRPRRRRMRVVM